MEKDHVRSSWRKEELDLVNPQGEYVALWVFVVKK